MHVLFMCHAAPVDYRRDRKNNDDGNGQGGNVDSTHENEGHDRKTIAFPPGQLSLAASLSAQHTGTPLVCVLVHGGSLAPATLMRDCDAIVDLWCTRRHSTTAAPRPRMHVCASSVALVE